MLQSKESTHELESAPGGLSAPAIDPDHHLLLTLNLTELTEEIQGWDFRDNSTSLLMAYRRIHLLNRAPLNVANRLRITSRFHSCVISLADHYQQLVDSGATLSKDATDYFINFLYELINSYKRILIDSGALQNNQQQIASLVFMIMEYHYLMLQFGTIRGRWTKPKNWQEIHYLYFLCRERGQQDKLVNAPNTHPASVDSLYKANLLFGLAASTGFSIKEQLWAAQYLKACANLLGLAKPDNSKKIVLSVNPSTTVCVDHDRRSLETASSVLLVDSTRLLQQISRDEVRFSSENMRTLKPSSAPATVNKTQICRHLTHRLQPVPQRKGLRQSSHQLTGLIWGIEPLVELIQQKNKAAGLISLDGKHKQSQSWTRCINESSNGARLETNAKNVAPLPVDQLTVMTRQINKKVHIQLSVVRWSAYDETGVPQIGVEKIKGTPLSIVISHQDDEASQRPAILVIDKDKEANSTQLFVFSANAPYKAGKQYLMWTETGNNSKPTKLLMERAVQQTAFFVKWLVHVVAE